MWTRCEAIVDIFRTEVEEYGNSRTKDYCDPSELPRALALHGSILAESIRRNPLAPVPE